MKKALFTALVTTVILTAVSPANAHGGRGGHGVWRSGWAPFALGAVTGVVIANSYYRPQPIYYAPQYPYPQPQSAAYCPENGLYYPQTQACPSGWQRVAY